MKIKQHLISRGMNPDLYSISYGDEDCCFFLYNLSGQIVGYQKYNPFKTKEKNNHPKECRYFTYLPSGIDGIFGLELLDYSKKELYIVEGIFKAAVLHRLGYNALAVLSNNPKRLKSLFRILKQKFDLIAIGDNDPAGKMLVNFVKRGAQSQYDLDEMNETEILNFLKTT